MNEKKLSSREPIILEKDSKNPNLQIFKDIATEIGIEFDEEFKNLVGSSKQCNNFLDFRS
jgi:hypothetical protein